MPTKSYVAKEWKFFFCHYYCYYFNQRFFLLILSNKMLAMENNVIFFAWFSKNRFWLSLPVENCLFFYFFFSPICTQYICISICNVYLYSIHFFFFFIDWKDRNICKLKAPSNFFSNKINFDFNLTWKNILGVFQKTLKFFFPKILSLSPGWELKSRTTECRTTDIRSVEISNIKIT